MLRCLLDADDPPSDIMPVHRSCPERERTRLQRDAMTAATGGSRKAESGHLRVPAVAAENRVLCVHGKRAQEG